MHKIDISELDSVMIDEAHKLPESSGIYIVISRRTDEILYVGMSQNIQKRWNGHHRERQICDNWPTAEILWIPCSAENLAEMERNIISLLSPILNSSDIPQKYRTAVHPAPETQFTERIDIRIDRETKIILEDISKTTGMSMGHIVRWLVENFAHLFKIGDTQ